MSVKAVCAGCGERFSTRSDGTMRKHKVPIPGERPKANSPLCEGSEQAPVEGTASMTPQVAQVPARAVYDPEGYARDQEAATALRRAADAFLEEDGGLGLLDSASDVARWLNKRADKVEKGEI